ncbi:MAG: alpha/beta hydrolase [Ktedonobacterales bacterium]
MTETSPRALAPRPAPDYPAAMERLGQLEALDGPFVNPNCRTQSLTHGAVTDRAIILAHGMTNCPYQFRELAPRFFEQGYNVLIPRLPRNCLRDLDTRALAGLTLREQIAAGHEMVDIARGLGRHITIVGISAGGTLVAWLAQHREDVDVAVTIAPLFGLLPSLPVLNMGANAAVMRLLQVAPNIMTQRVSPFKGGPTQSYRGFATRGLASAMRLGAQTLLSATRTAPRARTILMMLNPADPAVNNPMSLELLRRWQRHGAQAGLYEFDAARNLIHDVIDPAQAGQQCDYTYPILLERITSL